MELAGISGRVAIVTGGAGGIGAGLVSALRRQGAQVVIADLVAQAGEAVAQAQGAHFVQTDLTDDAQVQRLVEQTQARCGGIDFLFNVACTYADGGPESDRAAWRRAFDVNVISHLMLLEAARPLLARSEAASVVHFTSSSARIAQSGRWTYPATKSAIARLTQLQAQDLAADGIRVNAVLPAWVRKQWQDTASPEVNAHYDGIGARLHMLGRSARLDEVADCAMFLCSSQARFINGVCLAVDGGNTAMGPQGRERMTPASLRTVPKPSH